MKTAIINFKTDPKLKAEAQKRAKKLGISLSIVMNDSLRDFASGKAVHIEYPEEIMTPQMEKIIERGLKEIAQGEVSPAFDKVDDMMRWLESEDDD